VNAACAGFSYALGAANGLVRSGLSRCALVIGAERMTDWVDPGDIDTATVFADGAGAAVVTPAARTAVHPVAEAACRAAGATPADLRGSVPHQADLRMVNRPADALGVTGVAVADDIVASGNTSAASIPLALARLIDLGRVRSSDPVLLLCFGAGLSYAAQVIDCPWPPEGGQKTPRFARLFQEFGSDRNRPADEFSTMTPARGAFPHFIAARRG
jgi:3-oxoacyl-[acyl-carrier-protein] synthase-3